MRRHRWRPMTTRIVAWISDRCRRVRARHGVPLRLAVAGGTEMTITNNVRDFLQAQFRFPGLRTVSLHEFLKELI